jgi:hypothetical protein
MSKLLQKINYKNTMLGAPLSFEHEGTSPGLFTRYLALNGNRAYKLSFSCDTCYFLFERLDGANDTVSIQQLTDALGSGLTKIDKSIYESISPILPIGEYEVLLLELIPELVSPLFDRDYFSHEQTELWGIDGFWGLPHYPKTTYYRSDTQQIGNKKAFFEFVVPMVPNNWLKEETWQNYIEKLSNGKKPTALAISVFDTKQPANWNGDPSINEHWCLAHFLLDGHHKIYAAAKDRQPITLLSFLAIEESISYKAEIDQMLNLLSQPD